MSGSPKPSYDPGMPRGPERLARPRTAYREPAILALILLAAASVRLVLIDQPFIDATSWRQSDTAGFAYNFYQFDRNPFVPNLIWNGPGPNPAGYEFQTTTYLASLLYPWLGVHDWIGRGISVGFGVLGVLAFFLLVRRVWNARVALLSAVFLAVIPGEIYVDRSFLPDPVMLSLVVTSAWALTAYLQTRRLVFLCLACVAGALGLLTKISGAIVAAPLLYAVFVHERRGWSRRADARAPRPAEGDQALRSSDRTLVPPLLVGAVVVLAPVAMYYEWAMTLAKRPPYYSAAGAYWVWKFGLVYFLKHKYFLPRLLWQLKWFWTIPLTAVVALGALLKPPTDARLPFFFHAWLIGFAAYYLIAAQGLVQNPTNLNLMNPAAAALAANALLGLWAWAQRYSNKVVCYLLASAAVVWICLFGAEGYRGLRAFAYRPWSQADYELGLALRRLAPPNDLVVVSGTTEGDPTAIYYSRRRGWIFPPLNTRNPASLDAFGGRGAIPVLEDLRRRGAGWYGVVAPQRDAMARTRPAFLRYVDRYPRYQAHGFVIYRLNAPQG
jgi:hypothetical protein